MQVMFFVAFYEAMTVCKAPSTALAWHRDQGHDVALRVAGQNTRIWVDTETGRYTVVREFGPLLWCWERDGKMTGGEAA